MKIYLVVNEWSTETASGVSHLAYDSYEKAYEKFEEVKKEEITECWDRAFDNGNIVDGYEVEEYDDHFEIWDSGYYAQSHTCLKIEALEVL